MLLTLGTHEAVYAGPGAWRTPCHSTSPRSPSDKGTLLFLFFNKLSKKIVSKIVLSFCEREKNVLWKTFEIQGGRWKTCRIFKLEKLRFKNQKKIRKIFFAKMNDFSNYFLSFLNPSDLQFYCSFDVFHLEKLENVIFQIGKKNLFGKIFFSFLHTKRQEKSKNIFCYHNCPELSLFE